MDQISQWLSPLTPLFQLVIAVSAFLAVGYMLFQLALSPIREQVTNHIPSQINAINEQINGIHTQIDGIHTQINELKVAGQERDKRIERIENKLDQLIAGK